MTIQTRDFGELLINENEIITMNAPILGFDDENEYVLLIDDESDGMFSFLQSVKSPDVCFVLTNPLLVFEGYNPTLSSNMEKELGVKSFDEIVFRVITVIPDDFQKATVNLKSPVVISPTTKRAAQIVLEDDYPLRALLCEMEG